MKSQMLTILLLIIGAFFFQPTHQYRLSKRELTEYDLTSFIVSTCSASKTDMLIKSLCDQTLQSALMGNFPFLTYYCTTLGAGMSYCNNINRHTIINQDAEAKQRFVYRRFARSLNGDNKLYRKGHEMDIKTDLKQKLIMQKCIKKTEKSSMEMDQFCNKALQEVQQERYPETKRFCKFNPDSNYCRHIWFHSSPFPWLPSPSSSSSTTTHSTLLKLNPLLVSSSVFEPSDIESNTNQQRINKEK